MSRKLPPQFEINIDKLNIFGQGVGRFQNRQARVWGAVPGDKLLVRPLKKKRGIVEAGIIEVLEPALERRPVSGEDYVSAAPWAVIEEEKQAEFKKQIVLEAFKSQAAKLPARLVELMSGPRLWNYRNKMEYSFALDGQGRISLALHLRFRHNQFYILEQSAIAHERLNECGRIIVAELNKRQINIRSLKYLLLRYSYFEDKCIAALYVTDKAFAKFLINHDLLKGWKIIYSDPKSPTTVSTRMILETGENELVEQVRDLKLAYDYRSFFQINPPAFMHVLKYVLRHVPATARLVDLYAGVGTIGLCLAPMFDQVILAESDPLATRAAAQNIKNNNISNAQVHTGESEKLVLSEFLNKYDCLLVDPPRSGLHPKAIKQIMDIRPKHFIYVSCNPLTQARDFAKLKKIYKTKNWQLFDMYPQTPHCESVIIMKRKPFR